MNKKIGFFLKLSFLTFVITFFTCNNFYSASSKKKNKKISSVSVVEEKTAISSEKNEDLKNKKYTYFSSIDESIIADVEIGSPSSLRRAASSIRKSEVEYLENEKVLLAVESNIMQMVYPTERVDLEIPSYTATTSYIGAIQSSLNGIYDVSTGNVDFLTIVLPSLVVTQVNDVSGFFTISEQALLQGIEMRPNSVLANYLLGILYKKNNMFDKSIERFSIARSLAGECFQISYSYAEMLNIIGKVKESDSVSLELLNKNPTNVNILKLCAYNSYKLNNLNSAEEYISRVLQQNPNDLDALLFRAKILMAKKDYIRVASILDIYARQDTLSKDYLLLRTQLQYDWSKNFGAAISTIENALKLYPEDTDVQLYAALLASSVSSKVAGKSAVEYAEQVLIKEPKNETALQYAVQGLIQKKDYKKAYELSSLLISNHSNNSDNIFNHVKICLEIDRKDEAWSLISPIYRENSSDENVIQTYIITLDETERDTQALTLINQLLPNASSKMKSFLYYRRSLIQKNENDILSDLRSSLIANPRNSDSLFKLYKIYFSKKDYRKAQYYLKQVVALNPNDELMHQLNDELTLLQN